MWARGKLRPIDSQDLRLPAALRAGSLVESFLDRAIRRPPAWPMTQGGALGHAEERKVAVRASEGSGVRVDGPGPNCSGNPVRSAPGLRSAIESISSGCMAERRG